MYDEQDGREQVRVEMNQDTEQDESGTPGLTLGKDKEHCPNQ